MSEKPFVSSASLSAEADPLCGPEAEERRERAGAQELLRAAEEIRRLRQEAAASAARLSAALSENQRLARTLSGAEELAALAVSRAERLERVVLESASGVSPSAASASPIASASKQHGSALARFTKKIRSSVKDPN